MTPARQKVLQFIEQFIGEHGYAPTYDEMMKGVNARSRSTVWQQVQALWRDGFIEFDRHPSGVVKWRGIWVIGGSCPFCGHSPNTVS